jgi:hypothetical protein
MALSSFPIFLCLVPRIPVSDIHMTLQTAFAQTQRAIIGIESLRRMMPARPGGPIVESFADFHLRQCTLVCLFLHCSIHFFRIRC